MIGLTTLIDAHEVDIRCGHCSWTDARSVSWLSERRDMTCPACTGVIVLNTSDLRRRIASLRRQVSTLHRQLIDTIPATTVALQRESPPVACTRQQSQFALFYAYREKTGRPGNSRAPRPTRR